MKKLLLTVIVADPEQFTAKGKSITYIEVFVKLYKTGKIVYKFMKSMK